MDDQPTNGTWKLLYKSHSAVYLQKDTSVTRDEVRVIGPDREANAALFIRAQHMDELVAAARDAALVLRLYSKETKTGNGDYEAGKLDDILAKIKGDNNK